jgi:acylpyruvate hydrolase
LRNRDHITELNNSRPKQPFFFLKPSSSILSPGAGPVIRPKGIDLHYEVELALIMGKEVRDLDAADEKGALDAIESMLCLFQHFKLDLVANSRRLCYEH